MEIFVLCPGSRLKSLQKLRIPSTPVFHVRDLRPRESGWIVQVGGLDLGIKHQVPKPVASPGRAFENWAVNSLCGCMSSPGIPSEPISDQH